MRCCVFLALRAPSHIIGLFTSVPLEPMNAKEFGCHLFYSNLLFLESFALAAPTAVSLAAIPIAVASVAALGTSAPVPVPAIAVTFFISFNHLIVNLNNQLLSYKFFHHHFFFLGKSSLSHQ